MKSNRRLVNFFPFWKNKEEKLEFFQVNDALLHAISEEYVEAVEMLLYHEETTHKPGEPYV